MERLREGMQHSQDTQRIGGQSVQTLLSRSQADNQVRDRNIPSSPVLAPAKEYQPREGQGPVLRRGCDHKGAVAPRDDIPLLGLRYIEVSLETWLQGKIPRGPNPQGPFPDSALPLRGTSVFGT